MDEMTWLTHCKMTAVGGSEEGQCECTHPLACPLRTHPDFDTKRHEAVERMVQHFAKRLPVRQRGFFRRLVADIWGRVLRQREPEA